MGIHGENDHYSPSPLGQELTEVEAMSRDEREFYEEGEYEFDLPTEMDSQREGGSS